MTHSLINGIFNDYLNYLVCSLNGFQLVMFLFFL